MAKIRKAGEESGVGQVVLEFYQGESVSLSCSYLDGVTPINVTDMQATMTFRNPSGTEAVILTLTQDSGIALGNGTIVISLTAEQTALFAVGNATAVFDFKLVDGTTALFLFSGTVNCLRPVTR